MPVHVPIDVDVAVVPIETVVPKSVADGITRSPSDAGRERTTDHVTWRRREIIRRVCGIRPSAVDHRRLVIGHVDDFRRSGRDHDHRLVGFLGDRHRLLLGRGELAIRLS